MAPNVMGYDHFQGVIAQLYTGGNNGYFSYNWVIDGVTTVGGPYTTTQAVDTALTWIDAQARPWFCHVAFHAAHTPHHTPPLELITEVPNGDPIPHGDAMPWYKAMIEALDTEIGRLWSSLDPNVRARTTVILVADNGTPGDTVAPPFDPTHGKLTVYEGGVNVPMIVAGYGVENAGSEVNSLVMVSDLFATIAELAGVDLDAVLPGVPLQSESIVPTFTDPSARLRDMAFAELFYPNGLGVPLQSAEYAAIGKRYKLLFRTPALFEEFYDLETDPYEQVNLKQFPPTPEGGAAYAALKQYLLATIAL
jgi:arylsulfatase A-like enzyme